MPHSSRVRTLPIVTGISHTVHLETLSDPARSKRGRPTRSMKSPDAISRPRVDLEKAFYRVSHDYSWTLQQPQDKDRIRDFGSLQVTILREIICVEGCQLMVRSHDSFLQIGSRSNKASHSLHSYSSVLQKLLIGSYEITQVQQKSKCGDHCCVQEADYIQIGLLCIW